jgi:DMSO/TMAO reductase YedYZ molybdopterin-dependent catalytic subunit
MKNPRHWHKFIHLVLGMAVVFATVTAAYSAEPEGVVHIGGDVSKPGDWTVSRIRAELASEIKSVQYSSRGQQHTSNCVPLLSVLNASGIQTELKMDPKADPKTKNFELRLVVVIEGHDGYVVAFSLAELLAGVGNRHVWIALDMDGQPLTARDAPMRLIVPDDEKPARWVHAVETITAFDGAAATTRPAS